LEQYSDSIRLWSSVPDMASELSSDESWELISSSGSSEWSFPGSVQCTQTIQEPGVQCTQTVTPELGEKLLALAEGRQWRLARELLLEVRDARKLLLETSACEVLSWVAYSAGGAGRGGRWPGGELQDGSLEFLWEVLRSAPTLEKIRRKCLGFLPLHDAAWGRSPSSVALALLAVFPEAADVCSRSHGRPWDVLHYYHRGGWGSQEHLSSQAFSLLGEQWQLHSADTLARLTLQLSQNADSLNAMERQPFVPRAVHEISQKPRFRWRRRWPRGLPVERESPESLRIAAVDYVLEPYCRDSGRYAGISKVRNRRCSFLQTWQVAVRAQRFHLQAHCSHTVNKEAQRCSGAKWPSKAAWQSERNYDRWDKLQLKFLGS